MIRILISLIIILFAQSVYANLLDSGYVSPERYAVNEADMVIDYSHIPPPPKLDIDKLDDMRFQAPNLVEKDFEIGQDSTAETEKSNKKVKAQKSQTEKSGDNEAYKKRLSYKIAKWWVDQRYKREEAHHGNLHEIKVQKRLDYEKKLEEEAKLKEQQ